MFIELRLSRAEATVRMRTKGNEWNFMESLNEWGTKHMKLGIGDSKSTMEKKKKKIKSETKFTQTKETVQEKWSLLI